jgi:hypothetical protein
MKSAVSNRISRCLVCATIGFIALFLASTASAAEVTAGSSWNGPVLVQGNDFLACPDDVDFQPPIITVEIIDPITNAVVASHSVSPSRCRYIVKKDIWIGGGAFSTYFTVDEIGLQRHWDCALLMAKATSTTGEIATAYFQLQGCIN